MKYFSALADAAFARLAFTAAGLDFDKAIAAKDADVIKSAIVAGKNPDAESILSAAKTENDDLKTQLETVTKSSGAKFTALVAAVDGQGFKVADATDADGNVSADKLAAQKKLFVAKEARAMVAKAGHPGVLDEIPADAQKPKEAKKTDDSVRGEDRLARDFNAQLAKLGVRPGSGRN